MSDQTMPSKRERCFSALCRKKALLLALLTHLFILAAVPTYTVRITSRPAPEPIPMPELFDPELPPKKPEPIPRPMIPVEAEDDEQVPPDNTIASTLLDPDREVLEAPVKLFPAPGVYTPHDTKPEIIKYRNPEYPRLAVAAEIQGRVRAHLFVDTDGRVKEVRIISGHDVFFDSVREAASRMLFRPASFRHKKVGVWVSMVFSFSLD